MRNKIHRNKAFFYITLNLWSYVVVKIEESAILKAIDNNFEDSVETTESLVRQLGVSLS